MIAMKNEPRHDRLPTRLSKKALRERTQWSDYARRRVVRSVKARGVALHGLMVAGPQPTTEEAVPRCEIAKCCLFQQSQWPPCCSIVWRRLSCVGWIRFKSGNGTGADNGCRVGAGNKTESESEQKARPGLRLTSIDTKDEKKTEILCPSWYLAVTVMGQPPIREQRPPGQLVCIVQVSFYIPKLASARVSARANRMNSFILCINWSRWSTGQSWSDRCLTLDSDLDEIE
ncbi:hypothetical protein EVAR_16978_1 [Eumeta japonica]|uniref:Uncharacterized protein n=1 Tax=Eumeta variegata TaxID=151549 RepID=A0A4C1TVG3_EUMVA|nr:hypothetical protein EVAR_16978_1 [Eumeta japonica]